MTEQQAMRMALEALENSVDLVMQDAYNAEQLYGNYPARQAKVGGLKLLAEDHQKAITALRQALEQRPAITQDWSVFNTGAEVASGLTFDEAWEYMTPERLERGWSAVCVINKDNPPLYTRPQPAYEPVALRETLNRFLADKGVYLSRESIDDFMQRLNTRPQSANKSSLFDSGVYVGSHIGKEVEHTSLDHQPWVGLTDEELSAIYNHTDWNISTDWNYERAIEAALRSKNT